MTMNLKIPNPSFWGGDYINYVRVVIPANSFVDSPEDYDIEDRDSLKFWESGFIFLLRKQNR